MSNASTSANIRAMAIAQNAMFKGGIKGERRREWLIWGSIHRLCPTCSASGGERCWNMAELKKNHLVGVRWPHESRVDWPRIVEGLKRRGYIED